MPQYDYRCKTCGYEFSERHGINETADECPECESADVVRLITHAPTHAQGVLAHPGDGRRASAEQLRDKWREETPKLRKKLRDKLGEDAVKKFPNLNMDIE